MKMLISLELHHTSLSNFAYLYIFKIGRENDKEKKKNTKKKYWSHPDLLACVERSDIEILQIRIILLSSIDCRIEGHISIMD